MSSLFRALEPVIEAFDAVGIRYRIDLTNGSHLRMPGVNSDRP